MLLLGGWLVNAKPVVILAYFPSFRRDEDP